jgi:hypothetical protein
MTIWRMLAALAVVVAASCGTPEALEVRPFHMRDLTFESKDEPMIRGEQRRRLHGAIGVREQEQRLGHYYTVLWHDEAAGEPVRVVFEYQQGSTGSRVLRQEQGFDGGLREGQAEFTVIGDDYLEGGRVLAWRCRLFRGEREVASRQSYLWQ